MEAMFAPAVMEKVREAASGAIPVRPELMPEGVLQNG
jgi:hypothetical protein